MSVRSESASGKSSASAGNRNGTGHGITALGTMGRGMIHITATKIPTTVTRIPTTVTRAGAVVTEITMATMAVLTNIATTRSTPGIKSATKLAAMTAATGASMT